MSCAHSPIEIVVEKPVAVLPPAEYLKDCVLNYGSGTIEEVVSVLAATIVCERAQNAALRAWRDKLD